VGAGLIDTWIGCGFPFCCCEAAKNEILGGLYDCQRPSLLVALTMEIICSPTIRGSIINPLESSLRILVSNEFEDHFSMGGGPKGLGTSKIYLGVVFQIRNGLNLLRDRYLGNL
jgi:hypothetical protein